MNENKTEYWEEYLIDDADNTILLGIKDNVECNGRVCGYYGRKQFTITAPITLRKGYKEVRVSASEKKPLKVVTMLQIKGGWGDPVNVAMQKTRAAIMAMANG